MRIIFPIMTLFLAFLLDTAIIPVFYHGVLIVPLMLGVVMIISLRMGKIRGALFGMIGGLLADITAGQLPVMTMIMTAVGGLTSLMIPEYETRKPKGIIIAMRRFMLAFGEYMILEIVNALYTYLRLNAIADGLWFYAILRGLVFAVITTLLSYPLVALYPTVQVTRRDEDEELENGTSARARRREKQRNGIGRRRNRA